MAKKSERSYAFLSRTLEPYKLLSRLDSSLQQPNLTEVAMTCYSLPLRRSSSFELFDIKTSIFALERSRGQSSLGKGADRINACGCPPATLAPTTRKCDCLWCNSSADQQVTEHGM